MRIWSVHIEDYYIEWEGIQCHVYKIRPGFKSNGWCGGPFRLVWLQLYQWYKQQAPKYGVFRIFCILDLHILSSRVGWPRSLQCGRRLSTRTRFRRGGGTHTATATNQIARCPHATNFLLVALSCHLRQLGFGVGGETDALTEKKFLCATTVMGVHGWAEVSVWHRGELVCTNNICKRFGVGFPMNWGDWEQQKLAGCVIYGW